MTIYYDYQDDPMAVSADPGANTINATQDDQTLTAPAGPSAVYSYQTVGGQTDFYLNDTFVASNGDNTFYLTSPTDVVQAQSGLTGTKTVVSWSNGYILPDNVQNLTFFGAGNWGVGNSLGNLIIMGGNDQNTMDGGAGNDVLVGGLGENDFQFEVGGGHDVFYNFHADKDTVRIAGASFTSFAQIQSAMTQGQSATDAGTTDVVLHIDANDSITFRDTTIAAFQASDFLMPLDRSQLGALTFDDEFSTLQLFNPATGQGHWQTNYGGDLTSANAYFIQGNDEKQLYTAPNFVGQDGYDLSAYNPFSIEQGGGLDITAGRFAQGTADQHTYGQAYYSGMLNTRGVFMQKYGYFEMKADLPTTMGSWPAFWLSQDPYKPGVEGDVLEHLAMYPSVDFSRTVQLEPDGNGGQVGAVTGHTTYMPTLSGFHTYGMMWGPTNTTFYVDDVAVMQVATPTSWDQPMYMLLDMALGGWGGPIDEAGLPAQMKVDYVHVYGLASSPVQVSEGYATYAAASGVDAVNLIGAGQTITANNDGDAIVSNDTGNHLIGGTGNDTFTLGGGGDTAAGGGGADSFVVNAVPVTASQVTDFDTSDRLDLSGLLASLNYTGSNAVADGVLRFTNDGHGDAEVWAMAGGAWTLVTLLDGVYAEQLSLTGGTITQSAAVVAVSGSTYAASSGVTGLILSGSHQTVSGNDGGDVFYSNDTGNHLIGGAGNDTFNVGQGGDVITGGGGADSIVIDAVPATAGAVTDFGASDQLNLSGLLASLSYSGANPVADGVIKFTDDGSGAAQVWANSGGAWALVALLDGTTAARLQIAAGDVTLAPPAPPPSDPPPSDPPPSDPPPATPPTTNPPLAAHVQIPGDYNGDGASEIAFRNSGTGDWGYMASSASTGEIWHAVGTTSTDYASMGFGDFNGDGLADIGFRQNGTGNWGYMTANAAGGQAWHAVGTTSLDYDAIGMGDFAGDGLAAIAFRQGSTGDWGFMTANAAGGQTWTAAGPSSTSYDAVGVADFNQDGRADIAFRDNSTGDLGFMSANPSGGQTWHAVGSTSPDYAAIGVGDFNGDGVMDVAFRQVSTGDWGYMSALPSGGEVWHAVGSTSTAYAAVQTGDFNHDGLSDIAFRDAAGDLGYMSVNPAGGELWHAMGSTSTDYFPI